MDSLWCPRAEAPRHHGETTAARTAALRRSGTSASALRRAFAASVLFLLAAAAARATDFYAAPGGSSSGNGSLASPWDLQTALNQTVAKPGDTIWLRGGVYHGTYTSFLNGTASAPIVVRQYPGERATIDGGNSNRVNVLVVAGSYTWYWGFEIMSSDPNRLSTQTGSYPTDIGRGGMATEQDSRTGAGLKFINLIVHDLWSAGLWKEAVDSEFYGSIISHNGWNAPDRGHGHGLYLQNLSGTMAIRDNIIFENFENGIQCYGSETSSLDNFDLEGNTIFGNGEIVSSPGNNIIIGGGSVAQNPTVKDNALYFAAWGNGININMGYYPYGVGSSNAVMTGNYTGNGSFELSSANTNTTLSSNTIYSSLVNWTASQYPSNTFYSSDPGNTRVIVRPNKYEPGRANITVFNWGLAATVPVDVSGVLAVGQAYEIRNAENWFGAPVVSGTYDGSAISLPMTNLSVAAAIGWTTPPASGPEFNVFVLLPKSAASGGATAPDPHFSIAPNPASPGQSVQFTDTSLNAPTSWSWAFGDGGTSTAQNPTHVYASAGTYTVRLTAANSAGSASTTNSMTVSSTAPVSGFSFSPTAPAPSQSTQFTDTSSGTPTSWAWTFGDGGASSTESPTHVYAAAGSYTVTLKATNAGGSSSTSKTVTVSAPAAALPDPHFSITPNPATAGQTVQLTDTSLNSPTSWSWNFGDASSASNTSTAKNPTHVYAAAGTYTIRLTATNSAGSASTTNTVTVNPSTTAKPVASFTAAYAGTVLTEQFTDTSTGSPTSWSWNFGNSASGAANTSTARNPKHTFTKGGTYVVTLTASNAAGSGTTTRKLTVYKYRVVVTATVATTALVSTR